MASWHHEHKALDSASKQLRVSCIADESAFSFFHRAWFLWNENLLLGEGKWRGLILLSVRNSVPRAAREGKSENTSCT